MTIDVEEIPSKVRDLVIDGSELSQEDFSLLEPWIYKTEQISHDLQEYTLEEPAPPTKMLLPIYFQDLFQEFGNLNNFDLKDVIYEKNEQERFMKKVKEEIEQKQSITPLKKQELWKVIKESRFPIVLGVLVTAEGFFEVATGAVPLGAISYLRTGIYYAMAREGYKRGADIVKRDKVQRQYKEISDELQNLRAIILEANEGQTS